MNATNRRTFISNIFRAISPAALGRVGTLSAYAAKVNDYKALVCIFLLGGNDAHNMVIPISTSGGDTGSQSFSAYAALRPVSGVGLTQNSLLPISVNKDVYGLHPSLGNMSALYSTGKLAILANVGNLVVPTTQALYQQHIASNDGTLPENLYAHDLQQRQWQTGKNVSSYTTGWAGRISDLLSQNGTLPFPVAMSISQDGEFVHGITSSPASFGAFDPSASLAPTSSNALTQLLSFDNGLSLVQASNKITSSGMTQHAVLTDALNSLTAPTLQTISNRFQGLSDPLSSQMLSVAKIIAASGSLGLSRQIFFVTQGGYDVHSTEDASQGALFSVLDKAIAAFCGATQDLGVSDQVTTFTNSEFGRLLRANESGGTDHAWGGHHFIVGGAVKGGMYGTFPTLRVGGPDDVTTDPESAGYTIPTTSHTEYAATLAKWFGVAPNGDLQAVFPELLNFPDFNPAAGLGFL